MKRGLLTSQIYALMVHKNNVEKAMDWILSEPPEITVFKEEVDNDDPVRFFSFVRSFVKAETYLPVFSFVRKSGDLHSIFFRL